MYRKALTVAVIIFSALAVTAMVPKGNSATMSTMQQHKSPAMNAPARAETPAIGTAANPPGFSKADTNHDGRIEPNEALAIGIPFGTLDIDGDGIVTRSEYDVATAQHYAHG